MKRAGLLVILLAAIAAPAAAQRDPNGPDPANVKVRFGPIQMNPNLSFHDIGTDENVFNEAEDPKSDFTATVSPRTEVYLRFLGTYFTGKMNEDIVWYQKYASERQGNTTYGLDWKWPLTRLTVDASSSHAKTRERPGYEIDERAQRTVNAFSLGASFRFLVNTGIRFSVTRGTTDYDEFATFKEVNLHQELNVITNGFILGVTRRVTPLTNASLDVVRTKDRYPFNPERDSDRTDVTLGVRFDRLALLKGSFTIGYENYQPLSRSIPDYQGLTLTADLVYTLAEVTRFTLTSDRVVSNSYDITQPYYLQTGLSLEISQQVMKKLDIVGRGGFENLAYRDNVDEIVDVAGRTDHILKYGVGIGYHRGKNLRLGLNYDMQRRDSVLGDRTYDRPHIGTSVTYDF